jgi:hypothetical protein
MIELILSNIVQPLLINSVEFLALNSHYMLEKYCNCISFEKLKNVILSRSSINPEGKYILN